MQIIVINDSNRNLVQDFLSNAGTSLTSFRYFNTRSLQSLDNHLLTCVLQDDNGKYIGYGHLDKEDNTIWLGIAIAEEQTGKGLGKKVMQFLLQEASRKNIKTIQLSVDKANLSARQLYERMGFLLNKETGNICFYEKTL